MQKNYLNYLIPISLILIFQQSWVPGMFQDGYLYAAFGKNAAELGHWLVPHLSDAVYSEFHHHSPFVFILEGLFFKVFGASFTSARVFGGLFTLLTVLCVFNWVKQERGTKEAVISCIVLLLTFPLLKKSRFPGLDTPLMLFMLLSIKSFWEGRKWLLTGLFFGLSMLTKGPIGLFIPLILLTYLILDRKIVELKSLKPWCGLLLGFAIFGIWPLSLYIGDKFYIFQKWFEFTFLHTIVDSRGTETSFFTYIIFLFKNCLPWFLLALFSVYKNRDSFNKLMACFFLVFLILMSIPKFKYSHYIIPLYPFMAILVGNLGISDKWFQRVFPSFKVLGVLVGLALLIFPITNKSSRDPELFKILDIVKGLENPPKNWAVYKHSYPFYSLNNLMAFDHHGNSFNVDESFFKKDNKGVSWGLFIKEEYIKDISDSSFKPLIYFKEKRLYFYTNQETNTLIFNKKDY